jgi:hypothetical protein
VSTSTTGHAQRRRRRGHAAIAALVVALASQRATAEEGADAGADAATDGRLAPDVANRDAGPGDGVERDVRSSDGGGLTDGATPEAAPAAAPALVPLHGCVLEAGTRRPLGTAAITVDAVAAGVTDDTGCFTMNVRPGPHRLQVQALDHQTADLRVDVARATGTDVIVRMMPQLTGERYVTTVVAGHEEVPHVAVSADEARRTPGASNDPLRVLGSLPGVSQVVWPAAIYVVRGANPGNTGFFLDGIKVPALFHLALGPSIIHPYLLETLDFYPGTYPASFGGYVAGIVAARTAPAPADRVHASADVTVFDAGGLVTAPWDERRGTVAVAARYSYAGALLSLLETDTTLRYGDYQARVDHPLGRGRATVLAFGSLDDIGWTDPNILSHEYGALQFHRLDARWVAALGPGRLLAAATGGADWAHSTLFLKPIQVRALSASPRVRYDVTGHVLELSVGADLLAQSFVTEVPPFQGRQSDLGRSRRALTQGTFATLTAHAGPRVVASAGLRADAFAEEGTQRLALEPRADVLVRATDALSFKAGAGRSVQMPSLPVSVAGFESFGLADLGLQTSVGGALGVEARTRAALTLSTTGYYQRLRLTDIRNIEIATMDPTSPGYLVARNGEAYGLEVLVRRGDRERLYGWLAYTLSWSLREDDNGVVGPSDWDQRHIFNAVVGYRLRGGYSVGARAHYHSGRRAPIFNSGGQYAQLPPFYQLDLRADRRFVFDRYVLDVFLDFANATLTREVVQVTRPDSAFGQPPAPDLQQGFRIILPTVGVHGEF